MAGSATVQSGATRQYYNQPGTNNNVWNTPIGAGAIAGLATDVDTIAARTGGYINTASNYGAVVWYSNSASNPTAAFTGTGGDYARTGPYYGSGTPFAATAHLVPGSYAAGPYPGDNQYVFIDNITYPGEYWHFAPVSNLTSFAAGQGPFAAYFGGMENAMSDTFCQDYETGNANFVQAAGVIRAYDLDLTQNPALMPGSTTLTAIQHVLRYAHNTAVYQANAVTAENGNPLYPNGLLAPNSWPQLYQDYQSGTNVYSGSLVYGTQLFIPASVALPATNPLTGQAWTNAGKQLFWTLQNYGSISRDANQEGYCLYVDQNVPATWVTQAQTDLPALTEMLCPMRNQHQGGQSFTTYPMNGPGTRLDVGPPPLAALTTTTFTPSPNDTIVTSGSTAVITDAYGNTWGITSAGLVSLNGVADTTTANVVELAYVSGEVWQENTSGLWYGKTSATAAWTPNAGTDINPITGAVTIPPGSLPTAPVITIGTIATVSIALSWTSAGSGVSYQVNYRVTGATVWTAFGAAVTVLTALVTSLIQSTSYDFQVVATNTAGSATSATVTAATASSGPGTGGTNTAPTAPTGLAVSAITSTTVTLSWQASTGTAPIVYQPQYRLHQAPVTQATITGVTLSSNTGTANSAAGTVIGTLTAQATGVALTGTAFSIATQSKAGAFQIVGANLEVLSASLAAGSYSITISVSGTNATNSPQSYAVGVTIAAATTTSDFTIKGGKIYDPNGNLYVAKGVNATGAFSLSLFPGCNHVRYPVYPTNPGTSSAVYPAPSTFLSYAEQLTGYTLSGTTWTKTGTGTPVVLEIEDHNQSDTTYDALPPNTGAALAVQTTWYTAMASYFAGNPYVWLGGPNEIDSSDGTYSSSAIGAISTYELAIYNAIRAGSSTKMIQLMAGVGGSNIGTVGSGGGFIASDYAAMRNIVWEIHCYWSNGDSEGYGDYTTAAGYVAGGTTSNWPGTTGGWGIAGAQSIQSADGIVPVIIGEWGPSSGSTAGTDATQLTAEIIAVQAQGVGATAWCYADGGIGTDWELTNTAGTALTGWGSQVVTTL